ncbi:MAG: 6-phosphofructokinase [Kiritimatiellia bacterium]|nr:6-phosphofructokinase [Kiritimatiellia bacterium]
MAGSLKGNMLIAQSGGPSMVINQSLVGAVIEAKKHKHIKNIYGALHGIKGVLEEKMIDLRKESKTTLEAVAQTASSALGSVRKKPTNEECVKIFTILRKYDIRYFFYIGGNDSAETASIIHEEAGKENYDLHCFHIPKTIDNDLLENDHTPGFASAAKFVVCAVMGDDLDNRALKGVKIDVIMGRHAGFLTAASALAKIYPDGGPHLVYVPERPFSMEKFCQDVKDVYDRLGRCIVTVSEGIGDENGVAIASKFSKETDSHGNVQLSGTGALGDLLANEIRTKLQISRVRSDTFGYLQRSFPGLVSKVDAQEARAVGAEAVKLAAHGERQGSIVIRRKPGKKYQVYLERVPLQNVAKNTRPMPDKFINNAGNDVTRDFLEYARPLVGELPKIGRFKGVPVKTKSEKRIS